MIGLFFLGLAVFFCGYVAGRAQAQAKCDKVLLRRGCDKVLLRRGIDGNG